ncbi:MAG: hypothetical protein ACR2J1_03550, partial [Methyloceanibacter sp.]|uniref:hypothetical protein n=1 Tax=Methyloceanibacter sp. TaxID=1965321 RepID=UPI003D9BA46B
MSNVTTVELGMPAKPMRPANNGRAEIAQKPGRLVVVSNRVADVTAKTQTGGLAVALGDALRASRGLWFG